jgi:fluoride exporter
VERDLDLPEELQPEPGSVGLPRFEPRQLAAIFAGGLIGALIRGGLEHAFPVTADAWPWPTFTVNILGALLLGTFLALLHEREDRSPHWHPFLTTGVCGALSTFSTMMFELLRIIEGGHLGLAGAYTLASVICGLAAVFLATRLVRQGGWRS